MPTNVIPKYMSGEDTGWVDIEKGSALVANQGTLQCRKIGSIVQVLCNGVQLKADATGQYALLGNVPNGYRPTTNTTIFFYVGGGGYYAGYIQSGGNIFIFKGNASSVPASTNILFSNTYFVG